MSRVKLPIHLPAVFRPPLSALARVRWVFCLLALANLVFLGPMLVFGSPLPAPLRLIGAVLAIGLGWWWSRTYARGRAHWLAVLPEGIALVVITVAVGDPVRASGVLYTGLYFRACYGSPLAVAATTLAFLGAMVGGQLWSGSLGAGLFEQLVTNTIGFVSVAALMQVVVKALSQHERSLAREQALRRAGAALVAATDRAGIAQAALSAVSDLMPQDSIGSAIWFGFPTAPHLEACSDPALEPLLTDLACADLPEAAHANLLAGHPVELQTAPAAAHTSVDRNWSVAPRLIVPLMIQHELRGVVCIWSTRRLSPETYESLHVLAAEVALALESITVTEDLLRRKGEERFGALVQHSADVIVIISDDGTLQYTSPAATRVWGQPTDELVGASGLRLVHCDDRNAARDLVATVRKSGGIATAELRFMQADGSWRDFEVVATNLLSQPAVAGIVLNCHDVTERKALERQLRELAFHDPLTGLANRALLVDRLGHALARADRQQHPLGVLVLDLDDFKVVNDSLGHQAGDTVLRQVATRIRMALRSEDTAARLGGDEFAVLLEDVGSEADALVVADKLIGALGVPVAVAGREVSVGVSVGVALSTTADESVEDLLRRADLALYRAKTEGKGTPAVFEPSLETRVQERLEVESDLRQALDRGELHLVYQPIVTLNDRQIVEVEALLRWQHPRRGLISPVAFIPVAEDTGLIVTIGQWVLEKACRQIRTWQQQRPSVPPLVVSVNLSGRQFQHAGLVADVERVLRQTGIDPHSLKLEITESILMRDVEATVATCDALKRLGVQLSIDDFGTGYSSLGQLKRFPFDALKIDRSFVDGLGRNAQDAAIVQSVVTLARSLNLNVTAEGIETSAQEAHVRLLGCEHGQGYLFARPQPPEMLAALLAEADEAAAA
jgi:diguanylate cyclase (GGDEF)-like protein/PAS domain S-box-containing protein